MNKQLQTTNKHFLITPNQGYSEIFKDGSLFAHYYDVLESTNQKAKQYLTSCGLILCGYQSKGYGQRNRSWSSNANENILMSYFTTVDKVIDFTDFAYIVAKDLSDTLNEHFNLMSHVKKPNDIFIDNQKLAGILIEVEHFKNENKVIIGLGLNHLQKIFNLQQQNPTSLILHNVTIEYLTLVDILYISLLNSLTNYSKIAR